ncbi:MAG: DUF3164 family protein [Candidatus Cloacimonetes bacterium]|nr:DUF3164 family protein [Candidatus Cloacimonadota bacterium]
MALTDEKGWWLNNRGESVHKDLVRVNEQLRDEMVEGLIGDAKQISKSILDFKGHSAEKIDSYFGLLLQNYGIDEKAKTKKGNITLENFSGTKRVEVRVSETLHFDEKIQIAKLKIDEYLMDVTKDSLPEIITLITRAFEVDKEGNIDSKKIFALKSYDIKDPRWVEAMEIIDESKKIAYTKSYIRFYTRENIEDVWKLIPIDMAAV